MTTAREFKFLLLLLQVPSRRAGLSVDVEVGLQLYMMISALSAVIRHRQSIFHSSYHVEHTRGEGKIVKFKSMYKEEQRVALYYNNKELID